MTARGVMKLARLAADLIEQSRERPRLRLPNPADNSGSRRAYGSGRC